MWSTKLVLLVCILPYSLAAWGFGGSDPGKVRLQDVQVLTLKQGHMTTGRRSSPVSQLNCVGGSAKGQFNPQVVQCYNRGWDGQDVQWECKSDMDNLYRFGNVEVVCEGYEYPDDPYILKGSCGLEYTLELTKEGHDRGKRSDSHDYGYGGGISGSNYGSSYSSYQKSSSGGLADLIVLAVVCLVIYALYKTCIDTPQEIGDRQYSSTGSDYPGGAPGGSPGGGGWFGGQNQQRGQGYNGGAGYDNANCGGARQRGGTGAGGFWGGMATGGLLGYMFGNRGGYGGGYGGYGGGYNRPNYGGGFGGFGGGRTGGGLFGGGGGSLGGSSSGTRTASGFGGTRRR